MTETKVEYYTLNWLSRPDPKQDGKQMHGSQTFEEMDDVIKFMRKKLAFNGTFVSLSHTVTIRNSTDATSEMKAKLNELGPVELDDQIKHLYPDHVPVVFE